VGRCGADVRCAVLVETGFIDTLEGQSVQTQRKPVVHDGKIGICASDLQMYINKTTFQTLSVKAVASMLGLWAKKRPRAWCEFQGAKPMDAAAGSVRSQRVLTAEEK